ncbi:cytochrome P450 [Pseudomonas sessilinigenes]|uniref:Cytochrome P450 n=1 Tax=Pseudomonas sessilinigenes TaxID=658629 RepID=A0ABX8MXK2_9PSED|nr:cytochrome P450 [Pseudomonas sessilinigenes]AZC24104.1 putative cytochrome p450 oxidoreductase [Pseudomonas sessilinigenes]QXH43063.1 cytochrome P450 [Pseudomonas sessilinigenes]
MDLISIHSHSNPYQRYYAPVRALGGLTYDSTLGLWIASSAAAVAAVLEHPACRVRPAHEPVPVALTDGPAGALFARLMRMNDGPRHACPRTAIEPGLRAMAELDLQACLGHGYPRLDTPTDAAGLRHWQFQLPVAMVAGSLGVAIAQQSEIAQRTGELVAGLSPLGDASQRQVAHQAAHYLDQQMHALLHADAAGPLLQAIRQQQGSLDPADLRANLVGLLIQAHDACAGLFGNALLALLDQPALAQRLHHDPAQLGTWLRQQQKLDPAVHNTRRFVAEPCTLAGVPLQAGDTVLVLLAAANHDPALPPDQDLSFGAGRHQCPGRDLALNIVASLLQALLGTPALAELRLRWHYLPSLNGRIPWFNDASPPH